MRCEVDGHEWHASVNKLLHSKRGCPVCAGQYRYSQEEREAQLAALPRKTFLRWEAGYVNAHSRARMRCDLDGAEWATSAHALINGDSGCPKCYGNYRYPADAREAQLSELKGMRFVKWVGEFKNNRTKAEMRCEREGCGATWRSTLGSLITQETGCPRCAMRGFDRTSPGTLYALVDEFGENIKIGVSNIFPDRLRRLRRGTPFEIKVVAKVDMPNGGDVADLERLFHQNFESSGFTGFDGATEWLKFDSDILSLMRILGA